MEQTENYYFRASDCMLHPQPKWSIDEVGIDTQGMGDLIYRTAIFAITLQDWELLLNCIGLLRNYKRWPDWLEPGKLTRRHLKKQGYRSIRGQRSMTRDPYIATLAAISLMEDINDEQRRGFYNQVKIPIWMNRRNVFLYKRTLMNPGTKYLARFEKVMLRNIERRKRLDPRRKIWKEKKIQARENGQRFKEYWFSALHKILGYPAYVKFLHAMMAYTTGAKQVQEAIYNITPHWNYGVLLLTQKPTMYLVRDFIEKYQAKKGFQWANDELIKVKETSKHLADSEKYKMDKDFLDYLWKRYNQYFEPIEF